MPPLPPPNAVIEIDGAAGAPLRLRRHGNSAGPRLIFSHGNGFAIGGYVGFWSRFLADFEVVLFDARSHGWNPLAEPPAHDYAHMARDLALVGAAAADVFGVKPTAGVFHSMSAQAAMIAALELGWHFEALVLFDPPNNPAEGHPARAAMVGYLVMLAAWARTRREHFADPSELARDYAATRAGSAWPPDAHLAMARAVLRQTGEGWRLCCPRGLEAAMYEQGMRLDLWPPARAFPGPLKLIGADPARERPDPTALANQALAREGGYDYLAIPGSGHLMQLEQPTKCADAARQFLDAIRLSR